MSQNWQQIEKKNKRNGAIASVTVHAIILLIFLFLGFSSAFPPPEVGILVNFGTMETGAGDEPSRIIDEPEKVAPQEAEATPVTVNEIVEQEVVTQDVVEAPPIKKEEVKKEVKKNEEKKTEPKPEVKETKPVKEEPKVNPNDLYTGQPSDEDNPSNEGLTYGPGDQGDPNGDPSSDNYEGTTTGLGDDGIGVELGNRRREYTPSIKANSNEIVKVVVTIKVDRNGKVISAEQRIKGSTTTDPNLIAIAVDAAKKTKFNAKSDADPEQIGTMTFTFRPK